MTITQELIDRVERASGADRELFESAYTAINGASPAAAVYRHGCLGEEPDYEKGRAARRFAELVNTQAWLDAAMTLVPEGWTFANLSQSDAKGWWCELRRGFLTSFDKVAFSRQLENASPALAITAAALRARMVQS